MPQVLRFQYVESGITNFVVLLQSIGGAAHGPYLAVDRGLDDHSYDVTLTEPVEPGVYLVLLRQDDEPENEAVSCPVEIHSLDGVTPIGLTVSYQIPPETLSLLMAQMAGTLASNLAATKRVSIESISGGPDEPLTLVCGASYLHEHGRSITFGRKQITDLPVGTAVQFRARGTKHGTHEIKLNGVIVEPAGDTKTVRFEATSAVSENWIPGPYEYQIDLILTDGNTIPFFGPKQNLTVLAKVP